jgi:hypothetical protein
MSNRFWYTQVIPDFSSSTGIKETEIDTARNVIEAISSNGKLNLDSKATNLGLLKLVAGDFSKPLAYCLRCYISHQIKFTCRWLTKQHGEMGNFKNKDIFPYALEDFIEKRKDVSSKVLAIKILSTFNPLSGTELSTWTNRLVRRHPAIDKFLKDHGISPWTDWGLLNFTTAQDLKKATTFLQVRVEEAERLLTCFHVVYREDRQSNGKTGKCEPPTPEQLQRMCNLLSHQPSESLELTHESLQLKLKLIAKGIRNWKMGGTRVSSEKAYNLHKSKIGGTRVTGEQAEIVDEIDRQEIFGADDDRDIFLGENENRRDILLREINRVTRIQVDREYKRQQRAQTGQPEAYLQLLHLYFEQGMNQTQVAIETARGQGQMSRLLNRLRTDIVDGVFNGLQSKNIIPSNSNGNHDEFESIKGSIREYLDEYIIVDDRPQTVISQAVCNYLQSRGQG